MSLVKRMLVEQEQKKQNQLNGYRKKLQNENTYEMDCPYCCEALSRDDIKKEKCLHCGHDLPWNTEE